MQKKIIEIGLILIFVTGCENNMMEDPFTVAKSYCNCVEENMKVYKDSLINLNDCENLIYSASRLMQIQMFSDADPIAANKKYSFATLDSASKFSSEVIRIIDTMCFIEFDQNHIKKLPHIPMGIMYQKNRFLNSIQNKIHYSLNELYEHGN